MYTFFENNNLSRVNLCGVCADGAPTMIESRLGFQALAKHCAPAVKGVHCIIHRQTLASKTLPEPLSKMLRSPSAWSITLKLALQTRDFSRNCVTKEKLNIMFFFSLKSTLDSERKNSCKSLSLSE